MENLIIPVFNSNELNPIYKNCRPDIWPHNEFQAIKYLPQLKLWSVSVYSTESSYYQTKNKLNHQRGNLICTLSSNDIFEPTISFEEFYKKNGYKYDRFDIKDYMRELYDNYMKNPLIKEIFKSKVYHREIALLKLLD